MLRGIDRNGIKTLGSRREAKVSIIAAKSEEKIDKYRRRWLRLRSFRGFERRFLLCVWWCARIFWGKQACGSEPGSGAKNGHIRDVRAEESLEAMRFQVIL